MLARRDTQREAARLRHLSPLQTLEDQSQTWGICCHSCTWREGLSPSWPLSYKTYVVAVYPRIKVLFQPTDRTNPSMVDMLMIVPPSLHTGINTVLICIHTCPWNNSIFDKGLDRLLLDIG